MVPHNQPWQDQKNSWCIYSNFWPGDTSVKLYNKIFLWSVSWKKVGNTHMCAKMEHDILYPNWWVAIDLYRRFLSVREMNLLSFQYKIIHRITNCNKNYSIWKLKPLPFVTTTDIKHFFFACVEVQNVWKLLFQWWNDMNYIRVNFPNYPNAKKILLGISSESDECQVNKLLNHGSEILHLPSKTVQWKSIAFVRNKTFSN